MKWWRDLFDTLILVTIFVLILIHKIYSYLYWKKEDKKL